MTKKTCQLEECANKVFGLGYCNKHYKRFKKTGDPLGSTRKPKPKCTIAECTNPNVARGLCDKHYSRWQRHKDPLKVLNNYGEGYITPDGYRLIRRNGKSIFEHRAVMEDILNRTLYPGENVHHINGVKDDNRPENLELWVTSQPSGQRLSDLLHWAHEIIERYEGAL